MTAHNHSPRVALVSVGLGKIQRGFERYFRDLFGVLREHLDVTLYRWAGAELPGERVPPLLGAANGAVRLAPRRILRARGEYAEYKRDCVAYALALAPDLFARRFDVVHIIDPPLARVLGHVRRIIPFGGRLLFTEGAVAPVEYWPRADHVHHVSRAPYEAAMAGGVAPSYMSLVPCGLDCERFRPPSAAARQEMRRKHGIGPDTFVVLTVSALKREHKRVDHVIEEVSRMEGDVLLWLDGHPHDPEIPDLARRLLGSRCRITHVGSDEVPDLYACADVLAHASLSESFGLAIAEALSSDVMALVHDSPHFAWLTGHDECLVDMSRPGALAARLETLRSGRAATSQRAARVGASVRSRFDWRVLAPEYAAMYRRLAAPQAQREKTPEVTAWTA